MEVGLYKPYQMEQSSSGYETQRLVILEGAIPPVIFFYEVL